MKGKERCKALKEIRKQIAEKNDIEFVTSECKHQGDCKGTCPKCEAEVAYLERELEKRTRLGKSIAVAGIAVSICTGLTACAPAETLEKLIPGHTEEQIAGGIQEPEPTIEQLMGEVAIDPDFNPNGNSTEDYSTEDCSTEDGSMQGTTTEGELPMQPELESFPVEAGMVEIVELEGDVAMEIKELNE